MFVHERSKSYPATPTPWGKVPREVAADGRLSLAARGVYSYLATIANGDTGYIGPLSVRQLAAGMHVPVSTVQPHLLELRELGHVLVEKPGDARHPAVLWLGWGCPQARGIPRAETLWTVE